MAKHKEIHETLRAYLTLHAQGPGQAIPINAICEKFNWNRRRVEMATEVIRALGYPLCSSCNGRKGLFMARTFSEAKPWLEQINSRIKTMIIHRNIAVKALKAMAHHEGIQLNLFSEPEEELF